MNLFNAPDLGNYYLVCASGGLQGKFLCTKVLEGLHYEFTSRDHGCLVVNSNTWEVSMITITAGNVRHVKPLGTVTGLYLAEGLR